MPDSFFSSSKPRKRKRDDAGPSNLKKPARSSGKSLHSTGFTKKRKKLDEELDSDQTNNEDEAVDDLELRADSEEDVSSGEDDPDETPAEKRLRLAKLYLDSVKEGLSLADGEFDAAEIDKELIASRLRQDVMQHSGKVHLFIADSFDFSEAPRAILRTKGHRFSVTSAVASDSANFLYTSGKEGHIFKWDLSSGKKTASLFKLKRSASNKKGKGSVVDAALQGHTDEVFALALSGDGKYLVSGGKDRKLCVWDAEKGTWIKGFVGSVGHKDSISALSFRKGTHQVYTGSFDRTVKVYDLSPTVMGYVETLFGHQDCVLSLDSLRAETCISAGARDQTLRFWKIVDETQLVFRGGGRSKVREVLEGELRGEDQDEVQVDAKEEKKFVEGSLECVAMIDENTFVSGGDSGSLCLWTTQKKKPVHTQALSHGLNEVHSETSGIIRTPRWVTAVASLHYSDLFASGSWDGFIRLWQLDAKLKSFSLVGTLHAPGVVNSLQFITPPKEFFQKAPWIQSASVPSHRTNHEPGSTTKHRTSASPLLLVAGIGQEHRLGRWLTVKEGVANGALVFALCPRTFTSS